MNSNDPRRGRSRRDSGGTLLELALLTALIGLVLVALIGVVVKGLPTL